MAKSSYYFPHDYNARNDRKIAALIERHKSAGYGVFWIVCEMMHEEDGNIEFDEITFGAIAKDANESSEFVKSVIIDCISDFKLFKKEEDIVVSGRVSRNIEKRQLISKNRSKAGKCSASVRQMSTSVEQNPTNKINKIKEIKGISFSDDFAEVIFPDGRTQKLGEIQLLELGRNNLRPQSVIWGKIE